MNISQTYVDKLFKDKEGRVVLVQLPNIPLLTWLITSIAAHLFTTGLSHRFLNVIAFGALFTWAYLEVRTGGSYFRRLLGMLVLVAVVISRTRAL